MAVAAVCVSFSLSKSDFPLTKILVKLGWVVICNLEKCLKNVVWAGLGTTCELPNLDISYQKNSHVLHKEPQKISLSTYIQKA